VGKAEQARYVKARERKRALTYLACGATGRRFYGFTVKVNIFFS